MADLRRDRRYKVQLPASLQRGKVSIPIETEDVSKRGLYVRTDRPPALRSLVDLRIVLPPDAKELRLHAMVVHVQKAGKAGQPGAGLELYGLKGTERDVWEAFIQHLKANLPPPSADATTRPRPSPRYAAELDVRVKTADDLVDLVTQDAARTGIVVRTNANVQTGAMVRLYLVHPDGHATFPVDAIVRRRIPPPGTPALGVEFASFDDARRAELLEFVKEHHAIDLADDDLIDENQ
jgi:hypothetical protein